MTNSTSAEFFLNQSREVGLMPGTFSTTDGKRVFDWDETGSSLKKITWNVGEFLRHFKAELETQGVSIIRCTFETKSGIDDVYVEVADRTKISPKTFYESLRTAAKISQYVDGPARVDREYRHNGQTFYVPDLWETFLTKKSSLAGREYQQKKGNDGYIEFFIAEATVENATIKGAFSGVRIVVCDKTAKCNPAPIDLLPVLFSSAVDEKQPAPVSAKHFR